MVSLVGVSQKNNKHITLVTIILILNDQSSHKVTSINIFKRTQVIVVQHLNSSLIQIRFNTVIEPRCLRLWLWTSSDSQRSNGGASSEINSCCKRQLTLQKNEVEVNKQVPRRTVGAEVTGRQTYIKRNLHFLSGLNSTNKNPVKCGHMVAIPVSGESLGQAGKWRDR